MKLSLVSAEEWGYKAEAGDGSKHKISLSGSGLFCPCALWMNAGRGGENTNDETSMYVDSKEEKLFIHTFEFKVTMAEVQFNFFIFPIRNYLARHITARAEALLYSSTEDNMHSANLCAMYSCVHFQPPEEPFSFLLMLAKLIKTTSLAPSCGVFVVMVSCICLSCGVLKLWNCQKVSPEVLVPFLCDTVTPLECLLNCSGSVLGNIYPYRSALQACPTEQTPNILFFSSCPPLHKQYPSGL